MIFDGLNTARQKFLLVILDECATSFCHYEGHGDSTQSRLMSYAILKKTLAYARRNSLIPQFIFGDTCLPAAYESEINRIDHVRIVPLSHPTTYSNSIVVINPDDYTHPTGLARFSGDVAILRISRTDIMKFVDIVVPILGRCRRLNVCLLGIEQYTEEDVVQYGKQLDQVGEYLVERYSAKQSVEINCLTDRLVLRQMNNCDAGIRHLTVAPDGKLYICPAFYYCGDKSIGDVEHGRITLQNNQLLDIKYAPICSRCDAFQCKRCVFLNKKLTLEINTPSWQQCKIAHSERASSRTFVSKIDWPIPAIDYDDPFTLVKG